MFSRKVTHIKVNLTDQAYAALHDAAQLREETRTDTTNRSIIVYAALLRAQAIEGADILVYYPDGRAQELNLR